MPWRSAGTREELAKFKTAPAKVMNSGGSVAQNIGGSVSGNDH